jgi:RND family efflux transporter MFP subunit
VAHADEQIAPTSCTVFGQHFLLYLEFPHLVRGEEASFLAHLSVMATGEPVTAGRVALEIGAERLIAGAPKRDGLFVPIGSLPTAGSFPARLVVESAQGSETLDLGPLVVHPDAQAARLAAKGAGEEPRDAVPFLMEQQWKVKLLLEEARARTLVERLGVPAQVVTPEGREAVVSAPSAGRLLPGPSGVLPRSGDHIEAGQILALVEPLLGASESAQLQALRTELDLQVLAALRAASEASARLRFAEREQERLEALREQGLATRQELEQAARDLALARSDAESARATEAALEPIRRNELPLRLPVLAPLSGTIVAAKRVEGEALLAGDTVFRVHDTSRIAIEGRVSEFDLARLGVAPGAVATFPGLPGKRIALEGPYFGTTVEAASRTLLVRYEVDAEPGVRSGMLAELAIALASADAAVSIPVEAVIRDQGSATAYVMLEGELFQKRVLELGIEDGGFVEVRRGLAPGDRVATRGVYQLKLASLSPASFGSGHQH